MQLIYIGPNHVIPPFSSWGHRMLVHTEGSTVSLPMLRPPHHLGQVPQEAYLPARCPHLTCSVPFSYHTCMLARFLFVLVINLILALFYISSFVSSQDVPVLTLWVVPAKLNGQKAYFD